MPCRLSRSTKSCGVERASAERNPDFLCHFLVVIDQQDAQTALAGLARTKKAGRTRADDDRIECLHRSSVGRIFLSVAAPVVIAVPFARHSDGLCMSLGAAKRSIVA